jgi:hypothetical protein
METSATTVIGKMENAKDTENPIAKMAIFDTMANGKMINLMVKGNYFAKSVILATKVTGKRARATVTEYNTINANTSTEEKINPNMSVSGRVENITGEDSLIT